MDLFVVISGCSGGGKSTLLTELGRRGYMTVEEPGRRIVKEELLGNGLALRVIHTIHQAMTHHRSYQIRYTGESRRPRQNRVGRFLTVPPSHTTGRTGRVPGGFSVRSTPYGGPID